MGEGVSVDCLAQFAAVAMATHKCVVYRDKLGMHRSEFD